MGSPRSKASSSDISMAFATTEPFKAVAARLGLSPNTLRRLWKEEFGEEPFVARGKAIQAAAATATCLETVATRVYKDVRLPCSSCGTEVPLKTNQVAQMDVESFVCEDCKYDRVCPVCDQLVDGERGLSGHFRHRREAGDAPHVLYQDKQEEARWEGLQEGHGYVRCLECGHRAETLARHLKAAHGITAEEYRSRHGDVRIRSVKVEQARRLALQVGRTSPAYAGTKDVGCPSCGGVREVSKFFVPDVHDLRCEVCRAAEDAAFEEARWEGKTEPADYMECWVCGYRTEENLNSHIQNTHPELRVGEYARQFPKASINTPTSGARNVGAALRLNLTPQDLAPFKDDKGRVQVALAAETLGCSGLSVRVYCKEHKIPTRNRLAFQKQVLDALSGILGGAYEWEWSDLRIFNPLTGYRLYFDGYFPEHNLLVEVHGKQHFVYVPYWHKARYIFEAMQARDVAKQEQALALGFQVLTIRYDEPYTDVMYLRGRLKERGLLGR